MLERAVPILPGDDLGVAKEFYVGKLGFALQLEATEDGVPERQKRPRRGKEPRGRP